MRVALLARGVLTWISLGGVLLGSIGLTGCQPSEEQKAKATARAFFQAFCEDNRTAMKAVLTQKARRFIEDFAGVRTTLDAEYTLEQAAVTDDTAQVYFTLKEEKSATKGHLKLRREEGEWRVYAITANTLPGGGEWTINFENPSELTEVFRELGRSIGEALGKALTEGLKAAGDWKGK